MRVIQRMRYDFPHVNWRSTMATTIYLPRHQTRMTRSSKRAASRYKRQRRYLGDRQDGEGGWARWIVESVEKPPGVKKRRSESCEREKKIEWKIRRSERTIARTHERKATRWNSQVIHSACQRGFPCGKRYRRGTEEKEKEAVYRGREKKRGESTRETRSS